MERTTADSLTLYLSLNSQYLIVQAGHGRGWGGVFLFVFFSPFLLLLIYQSLEREEVRLLVIVLPRTPTPGFYSVHSL